VSTIRKLLLTLVPSESAREAHVHFHSGPQGLPAVCHDPRCASPRLEV
jgi:hypothetical protein